MRATSYRPRSTGPIGKLKGAEYAKAPFYYDMLVEWHGRLSTADQELVLTLADVVRSVQKGSAEAMAASRRQRRGGRCD